MIMRKKTLSLLVVSVISFSFASCEKKIENNMGAEPVMERSICRGKDNPTKDSVCIDSIHDCVLTQYFYIAVDMRKYPIYQSRDGKCFIIRTSARTGGKYKQYLPEMPKQANK